MLTDNTLRILKLVDHNSQFELNQNQANFEPLILNKRDLTDPNYIDQLRELIFADGSGADFIARCQCGDTEGNNKEGMTCPNCGTKVLRSHMLDNNNLMSKNWISCPQSLPNGWLAPKVYLILSTWLSYGKNKRNYLDDILNIDSVTPFDIADVVTGKGFQYLYDNFDRLMTYFIYDHPTISKKTDSLSMRLFLELNRDKLFCNYIPILNAAINPIITEDRGGTNKRRYSDSTADHILKAIVTLSRIELASRRKQKPSYVERNTFLAYKSVIAYHEEATQKYISTKKAIPRTHIFGARFHWSFRGVVVPIIGQHIYYELHWPWQMAVNTMRVQILGALHRDYGLSINEATTKHRRALSVVDTDIKDILNRMIDDSPYPGIPVLWDRPPSIRDGSVVLKYITKIKTDIEDSCVGMTPVDVALQNSDFDGDALAGIILFETEAVKAFRNLSTSSFVFNRNTGEVSNEIGINKTTAIIWNSWLREV